MLRRLAPALIGMGALQLGTAIDGLLAGWPVMVGPTLPGGGAYPMDESAASVLFFAARLYQFPLGVFGIAIATAVFPALARDWGNRASFDATLARGVRTSLFISLPATVGLVLVAEPLARVIYGGGNFGADDAERVTAALRAYAPAIWAYSLTHVLTRAFYASGDTRTPMLVGVGAVALNLALDVTLMFPLAERGLAWGTSIASVAQALTLSWLAHRRLASSAPGARAAGLGGAQRRLQRGDGGGDPGGPVGLDARRGGGLDRLHADPGAGRGDRGARLPRPGAPPAPPGTAMAAPAGRG
jgi:putative peptidoglycan lipid II flippase